MSARDSSGGIVGHISARTLKRMTSPRSWERFLHFYAYNNRVCRCKPWRNWNKRKSALSTDFRPLFDKRSVRIVKWNGEMRADTRAKAIVKFARWLLQLCKLELTPAQLDVGRYGARRRRVARATPRKFNEHAYPLTLTARIVKSHSPCVPDGQKTDEQQVPSSCVYT